MNAAAFVIAAAALSAIPDAPQTPRAPDANLPPTIGTGSIAGVVVSDETPGRPVRRAVVTLAGPGLRPSRGAITDDDGRFTIGSLPAGRFTLTAMRASFVTSAYGAKRPGRPGTAIAIADGEAVRDLVMRMWRGGVVTGVVRDAGGEPVADIPVTALRVSGAASAAPTLTNNNAVVSNDRGEYRIFGLEPGSYLISANPPSGGPSPMLELREAEVDAALDALRRRATTAGIGADRQAKPVEPQRFDYAPVYYPGTPARGQAAPIAIAPGQETGGLDITLQHVPAVVVDGHLTRPDGQPAAGAQVQLTPVVISGGWAPGPESVIDTTAGSDGRFRFARVTPGEYALVALAPAQPAPGPGTGVVRPGPQGVQLWAMTTVSVTGGDITGLALALQPAMTMTGRITFESETLKPPANLTQLRVSLQPPELLQARTGTPIRSIAFIRPATVRADGTFELINVIPGRYVFTVAGPSLDRDGWWARSAMAGDRDLLDGRIEVTRDMNLQGVEVTFTDRRSELSGTLQTASGAPASDVFVIAFATDRRHWGANARRVQAVRPGVDGRYVIKDLPPGEYFLGAVADADPDEWQAPGFLDTLRAASLTIAIGVGEKKVQDLRIGG